MGDFAAMRDKVRRRRETVKILLDQTLLSRHASLEAELARAVTHDARHGGDYGPSRARDLARELDTLEAEMDEARDSFTFEAIGAARWLKLVAEHPPTKEQKALGAQRNPDTFLTAALAASCVAPEISIEDAVWLAENLDSGEWARLTHACCLANEGSSGEIPKSKLASAILRLNDPSPSTRESEESPGPDSWVDLDGP